MPATRSDRIAEVLNTRYQAIEKIAEKTGITPACVKRTLTRLANDGKVAVKCDDGDKPVAAKLLPKKAASTSTTKGKRKLRPTKKVEKMTLEKVRAIIDAAAEDPHKLADLVVLLMDGHTFERPFSRSVRLLFGKRNWLRQGKELSGAHIGYTYELLMEHAELLVPLIGADVGKERDFKVVFETEGETKAVKVEGVVSPANAVASVKRSYKDKGFHLIGCYDA